MENESEPAPITAAARKGQFVKHDGRVFKTVQEGRAYILVPPNARTSLDPNAKAKPENDSQVQSVFYNPIQQFNRDLSVLAIKAFAEDSCQKKRLRHATQRTKREEKKERKRKREPANEEEIDEEEEEEEGVKLYKAADGSSVRASNGELGVEQQRQAVLEVNGSEELEILRQPNGRSDTIANGSEQVISPEVEWRPRFRILDALSATGLRALRYASEIPAATAIVANDRDSNAVKSINLNVQHNRLSDSITTMTGDAIGHMYSTAYPASRSHGPNHVSGKYDVIDLDPYGTAAPFIDAALQALEDGGMLCVTCTDSGVFASCGYSEKTFALYGGMPIKGTHSHEGGLRLVLHAIATSAAKYGISVEPLLSLSIDFYIRLFIRIRRSPYDVKFLAGKTMLVYGCDHGCGAWTTQFLGRHTKLPTSGKQVNWKFSIALSPTADRTCEECGSKMHVAGPMWGGPLHNALFIEKVLRDLDHVDDETYQTKPRVEGMLETALEETLVSTESRPDPLEHGDLACIPQVPPDNIDRHPFFFIPSALCKTIKAQSPAENMIKGALRHAGYRVARSHCKPGSIKTDAPWSFVWEMLREWVRQLAPIKDGAVKEGTPGWRILQKMRKDNEVLADSGSVKAGESSPTIFTGAPAELSASNALVLEHGKGSSPCNSNTPTKRLKVVFDEKLGTDKPRKRLVRYQMNPRENWGPMAKAKGQS